MRLFKIIIFFFIFTSYSMKNCAVTYELAGGRFGDQLLGYMHAKWISYKFKIPLLYKPFIYSNQLLLDDKEIKYKEDLLQNFKVIKKLKENEALYDFISVNDKDTLFIIPYFSESREELFETTKYNCPAKKFKKKFPNIFFPVEWRDKSFINLLRNNIKPKNKLNLINIPKDCISIAIHVRMNSNGFDLPLLHGRSEVLDDQLYVDVVFPLKHPPLDYYTEQLNFVLGFLNDNKKFIYIFTDHKKPEEIVTKIKSKLSVKIEDECFHFRDNSNNHVSNVLEDFFSMQNFNILIRADSNISCAAYKIGYNDMIITPNNYHWKNTTLKIDSVDILKQ